MLNAGSDKYSSITVCFSFQIFSNGEAVPSIFVSEMRFGYEHYIDFFVKEEVSYLTDVHLLLKRTCKIWV